MEYYYTPLYYIYICRYAVGIGGGTVWAAVVHPLALLSTLMLCACIYICRYAVGIPGGAVSGSVTVVLSVSKLGALG